MAFVGSSQQNIQPIDGSTTDALIRGEVSVSNPLFVKIKLNLEIQDGDLTFVNGGFDTDNNTLTLRGTPINYSPTRYVITYNLYSETGTLRLKNVAAGTTIFPVGFHNASRILYNPATITHTGGTFGVSVHPLSTPTGGSLVGADAEWNVTRTTGSGAIDLTLGWLFD